MSFSDAVSQVDQIRQWQSQLTDPATLLATASTSIADSASAGSRGGPTATAAAAPSTDTATFNAALAQAQASLTAAAARDLTSGGAGLPSSVMTAADLSSAGLTAAGAASTTASAGTATTRIQAMLSEAAALVGKPYVWGGGHDGWGQQPGYDCSGFVSRVLHAGGYLTAPQDTATLPTAAGIEQGAGQWVTIYDRDEAGVQGHVIIDIAGQFYESGGAAGSWGGGGGVQKIAKPSAAYLASFNDVLHPAGL